MKLEALKKGFAVTLAVLLIMSAFSLAVLAESESAVVEETETAVAADSETISESGSETETVEEETAPQYLVFPAEVMKDKVDGPSSHTEFSFVEENGTTLLRGTVKTEGNDPYMSYHFDEPCDADIYKYAMVLVRSDIKNDNTMFTIFYSTDKTEHKYINGGNSRGRYSKMSDWQFVVIDLTSSKNWGGSVDKVRFDFFEGENSYAAGRYCDIAGLVLSKDVPGLYEAANDLMLEVCPPVQALSDFTEEDVAHVSSGTSSTGVSLNDGNLIYMAMGEKPSDPFAHFNYANLADSRGIRKLTTEDFRYTVIRYRTSMTISGPSIELFVLTGDATNLTQMIRVAGTYNCHSGSAKYLNSRTWRSVMVDMAEDDGLEENTGLKYGWQGRGKFTGFRFDWCSGAPTNAYMEVSDLLFFKDKAAAICFSNAINTLMLPEPLEVPEEDETFETEDIIMPWETETETVETVTEETLPVFVESTESEETEVPTEETTETETETVTETEETTIAVETEETTEEKETDDPGVIILPNETESDSTADQGSQMPFVIACICLAGLSVASIVTVVVIKIKDRA